MLDLGGPGRVDRDVCRIAGADPQIECEVGDEHRLPVAAEGRACREQQATRRAIVADAAEIAELCDHLAGRIDYDDLILKARDLLLRPGIAPWVLYKLDGGIDHILVDEAQDTNHQQWDLIKALTEEFFSGKGAADDRLPDVARQDEELLELRQHVGDGLVVLDHEGRRVGRRQLGGGLLQFA